MKKNRTYSRATASKNLLPFAYGNAVKTSSLLC